MTFRILDFLKDNHIDYAMPNESAKVTSGWIGINCPFCSDDNFKLGFNTDGGGWNCWSCGGKNHFKVIARLANAHDDKAVSLHKRYNDGKDSKPIRKPRNDEPPIHHVEWPDCVSALQTPHYDYLRKRGFNPKLIKRQWGVKGTGPIPGDPRQLRIMIPVMHEGKMVCYQGRDITGKAKAKYWSLPKEESARSIKSCLYGYDEAKQFDTVVVCEGPTDVWRLGPGAVALFGVAYRQAQVRLLAEWKRVIIALDADEAGYNAIEQIRAELEIIGVNACVMPIYGQGDPADMTDEKAKEFMQSVYRNRI